MSDNNNIQPVYSFWSEQLEGNLDPDKAEVQLTIADTGKSEAISEKSTGTKGFFKRFMAITAYALVFGLIASISFLAFNKLYYHFNPSAEQASANQQSLGSGNSYLNLAPPEGNVNISTTDVYNNVSFYQETDISDIVDKTMPATVSITSVIQSTFNYFGRAYIDESTGQGSGIIIGENDTEYLIATNSHVVSDASVIEVCLIDDSVIGAYLKGKDAEADLAVIAIKKSDLSPESSNAISIAEIGNSDDVKVGQMVIAIGNALGYGSSVTVGYISAKERIITNSITNTDLTVIQVDAAINPGNSGGALLNASGEVIGINSAKLTGTKIEGIGYAIPITKALPIVEDLMNRETLSDDEKGYLGIYMDGMSDITSEIAELYNWPEGVYIREMTAGSAAEKAGLVTGDIITEVNGTRITGKTHLKETVNSYRYDTIVSVTIMRYDGSSFSEIVIEVKLGRINLIE